MDKKSFIMYKDIKVQIDALPDEEAGQLFKAIYEFQVNGGEKELSPVTAMVFLFIKQQFARDHEKYEVRVNASRRNGSKGGRPKIEKNLENPVGLKETQSVKKEPRKGDTVNVIDTVNDNVTVNDISKEGNKSQKPKKHKYGEYKHVLLTTPEHAKLIVDYPNIVDMITNLDEYIETTGKVYKNHNLVMRKWEKNKQPEKKEGNFMDSMDSMKEEFRRRKTEMENEA